MNRRGFLSTLALIPGLGWLKPEPAAVSVTDTAGNTWSTTIPTSDGSNYIVIRIGRRTFYCAPDQLQNEEHWCELR